MKRLLYVIVAMLVAIPLAWSPPAAADHQLTSTGVDERWNVNHQPQVAVNCSIIGSSGCTYVDNAISEWTAAGFHNGMTRVAAPDCTLSANAPPVSIIAVCQNLAGNNVTSCPREQDPARNEAKRRGLTLSDDVDPLVAPDGAIVGCEYTWFYSGTSRIYASRVRLCNNCTLSSAQWQVGVTHEIGHALGLHHTTEVGSIMNATIYGTEVMTLHERMVIRNKYQDSHPERFERLSSGLVADVSNGSTDNGADLIQWQRNQNAAQDWRPVENGDGTYFIYSSVSGKVLDVASSSTADNADITQWSLNRGNNQKVRFINAANGYQIKFEHSGKCLGTDGNSTAQGAELRQRPCGDSSTTWWRGTNSPADLTGQGGREADGYTDISVFRPASTATWLLRGPFSHDDRTANWGTTGDAPVPADYDGDHDPDVAVYRPSTGYWYLPNGVTVQLGGSSGDVPVPADYDGDGDAEPAVFRPLTGEWLVSGSSTVAWGTLGDIPVPGHYYRSDGTRKAVRAVFRPSIGTWLLETGTTLQYGTSGDIPVPADYNGDTLTDAAVFRPSTGTWFVHNGSTTAFGTSGDVPVVGNWDSDTYADIAVYRPSTNYWYIKDGGTVQYGTSGDVPLPIPYGIYDAFF